MVDCSCSSLRNVPFRRIKLHFFAFNAALACVLPFLPVHAKEIGISAESLGVIYSIFPLVTMVLKPFFGGVADHFNNLKTLLLLFLALTMLSSTLTVSIPRKANTISTEVRCGSRGTTIHFKSKPNPECSLERLLNKSLKCHMYCSECLAYAPQNNSIDKVCTKKVVNPGDAVILLKQNNSTRQISANVKGMHLSQRLMNMNCFVDLTLSCSSYCDPRLQQCFIAQELPEYVSDQFWLFFIFAMMCVSLSGVATSFSDAICFNELGEQGHLYGRQRLWGTVGWGLLSPIAGCLNDFATGDTFLKGYMPGAILLVVWLLYDIFIVHKLKTKNIKCSQNILKDVGTIICQFKVVAFITSVMVIGSFTALMWSFLFWYLTTLGAKKTILGVVPAVQCFLGELVFFFFSGKLINKMGHFNILTLNFICFGLRFVAYSYIWSPWMVLPIELLQGPTYGLFYATMASFAHTTALPGTEVTAQTLVGSAFELGMALGNLLGGISMQHAGGKFTFFYAGIISFIYCIVHIAFSLITKQVDKRAAARREIELNAPPEERATFM